MKSNRFLYTEYYYDRQYITSTTGLLKTRVNTNYSREKETSSAQLCVNYYNKTIQYLLINENNNYAFIKSIERDPKQFYYEVSRFYDGYDIDIKYEMHEESGVIETIIIKVYNIEI